MPDLDPHAQRRFAREVVAALRAAGYEAYWAGGCVRDHVLGRQPKDYDVATAATPDQIREVFGRRRTLAIGAAFGVITVLGGAGEGQVEVATFRQDLDYSDGRRPDRVVFTNAEEDARRRDFTINGLFFDPVHERVIDYVGGQEDIRRGLIRAIGDAQERFREDKLRMLRGVRFAATFSFELHPDTQSAIQRMAGEIAIVSPERIAQEMRAMLAHAHRARALRLLLETGLLSVILPEAVAMCGLAQHKPRQPDGDLWDHTLLVLEELRGPSFPLALAALLHDVGKPETAAHAKGRLSFHDHEIIGEKIAQRICRRWKLSTKEEDRVTWLVRKHMYLAEARKMRWAKLQRVLVTDGIEELLALHEADARASGGDTADIDYCRRLLLQPPEELSPPQLLTGHDLIRHGVPQGKIFQVLLEKVRDAQLEKTVRNKHEALELVDRLMTEGLMGGDEGN